MIEKKMERKGLAKDIEKFIDRLSYMDDMGYYIGDETYGAEEPSGVPLSSAKRKAERRIKKMIQLHEKFKQFWPKLEDVITKFFIPYSEALSELDLEGKLQDYVKCFIKDLAKLTGRILTEEQTRRLCAAFLLTHIEYPLKTLAKELGMSKNTLKQWVGWVEKYHSALEEHHNALI